MNCNRRWILIKLNYLLYFILLNAYAFLFQITPIGMLALGRRDVFCHVTYIPKPSQVLRLMVNAYLPNKF